MVRQAVGYHRYDTEAELLLLNEIYALLRLQINFFSPHQKLVSKQPVGAKVVKKHSTARTAYQRVLDDTTVPKTAKTALSRQYEALNPAQLRRDILNLTEKLLEVVEAKNRRTQLPVPDPTRANSHETHVSGRGHPELRARRCSRRQARRLLGGIRAPADVRASCPMSDHRVVARPRNIARRTGPSPCRGPSCVCPEWTRGGR